MVIKRLPFTSFLKLEFMDDTEYIENVLEIYINYG